MKKVVSLSILITALVAACVYFAFLKPQDSNVGGSNTASDTIIGSASNLKTLPAKAVFGNSTTTPPSTEYGMNDGAAFVMQNFVTENVDKVNLFVMAKGDTATSTLFIRQMGSFDNANYFDISTTTAVRISATTTLSDIITSVQWDPGLATTTAVIGFDTLGYKFTRFIVWSENLSTDPNDGVQAFITKISVTQK
jgi:hypothetical protein